MATFEKGILGGFSGKVGNVVGSRWRGKNVMRSLPQRGNYTPTELQVQQRERFTTVITFLTPMKSLLSKYFGQKQGDKSRYNLAVSYHLTEALSPIAEGFAINYQKVLISKGDLRGLQLPEITAAANQVLNLEWEDNSGQGNAKADDELMVVVYAPEQRLYQIFSPAATREQVSIALTLPPYMAGVDVEVWASFAAQNGKTAAVSNYLGTLTVL